MSRGTFAEWREEAERRESKMLSLAIELGEKVRNRGDWPTFSILPQSWSTTRRQMTLQSHRSVQGATVSLMDRALTFDSGIFGWVRRCRFDSCRHRTSQDSNLPNPARNRDLQHMLRGGPPGRWQPL